MYEIEDNDLKQYVNNPDNMTKTQKQMFDYLVSGLPETMFTIKDELNNDVENLPLLTLIVVLAKELGESKELIQNLGNAHDIPRLVHDILKSTQNINGLTQGMTPEELSDFTYDMIHYQKLAPNNKRLLALKAEEIGFGVDFTQITRDPNNAYLETLKPYFDFITHRYETRRNRGSNAALYQILRDYNEMDQALNYPKLNMLEQGTFDPKAPTTPIDRSVVPVGTIRAHFDTLPQNYGKIDLTPSGSFDFNNDLFFLNPETALYQLIMDIKPAGIFYELVVKATLYALFTDDNVVSSGDLSNMNQVGSLTDDTFTNGFRRLEPLTVAKVTQVITYDDDITSISNVKLTATTSKVNIPYDTQLSITGYHPTQQQSKTTSDLQLFNAKHPLTAKVFEHVYAPDTMANLTEVKTQVMLMDSYDAGNQKLYYSSMSIPEAVDWSKLNYTNTQSHDNTKNTLTLQVSNTMGRQEITEVTGKFTQDDYYDNTTVKSLTQINNIVAGSNGTTTLENKTDKAWQGTINMTSSITRTNPTNSVTKTKTDTTSFPIKIKDKFGREDFNVIVKDITYSDNYDVSFKIVNPNNFEINNIHQNVAWHLGQNTIDSNAHNSQGSNVTIAAKSEITLNYSITADGTYASPGNRAESKFVKITVTPNHSVIKTPSYPIIVNDTLAKQPVEAITIVEPLKWYVVEGGTTGYDVDLSPSIIDLDSDYIQVVYVKYVVLYGVIENHGDKPITLNINSLEFGNTTKRTVNQSRNITINPGLNTINEYFDFGSSNGGLYQDVGFAITYGNNSYNASYGPREMEPRGSKPSGGEMKVFVNATTNFDSNMSPQYTYSGNFSMSSETGFTLMKSENVQVLDYYTKTGVSGKDFVVKVKNNSAHTQYGAIFSLQDRYLNNMKSKGFSNLLPGETRTIVWEDSSTYLRQVFLVTRNTCTYAEGIKYLPSDAYKFGAIPDNTPKLVKPITSINSNTQTTFSVSVINSNDVPVTLTIKSKSPAYTYATVTLAANSRQLYSYTKNTENNFTLETKFTHVAYLDSDVTNTIVLKVAPAGPKWAYNKIDSGPFCSIVGYNPIGDSCSVVGETMVVAGYDIGYSGGCHELICKVS